jgi:hypothetical protein
VEVRVGPVTVVGASGRPRSNVIETGRHDVLGDDPFAAAVLARKRVAFELGQRARNGGAMSLGQSCVAADQCLDAD